MAVHARPGAGYERLRAKHRQAYAHLSKALQIDEAGVGEF